VAVVLVASAALYLQMTQVQPTTGGGPPIMTIATASATTGDLERSIRVAGVTSPFNYSTLVVPQMRGGRGNSMGDVQQISTGAGRSGGGGNAGANSNIGRGGGGPGGGQSQGQSMIVVSLVASGSRVKKGDVIATFDTEATQTRVDDFASTLAQRQAGLERAKTQLDVARKTHQQSVDSAQASVQKAQLDLKTVPVLSAIDAETLRLNADESEAVHKQLLTEVPWMETSLDSQWKTAQLSVSEAESELKMAQANLEKLLLRAPLDGLAVVQTMMRNSSMDTIKVGDQVGTGAQLIKVVDTSSMLVNASVNQVNGDWVRVGAKARVHFDAFPDLSLPAEVVSVSAMPKSSGGRNASANVKEIPLSLKLSSVDPRVIPDLSVSADIVLGSEAQTVMVPRQAVFQDGPTGKPFVYVQQASGWERRDVELGAANFISVAIRSGLKSGEVVACDRAAVEAANQKKTNGK
jgi:multidrug efflux pump subunit AcrA (membrane-fusion protein)